jgi:hypothetical protein
MADPTAHLAPRARVQRIGRWTYSVNVAHGYTTWGPNGGSWHVLGRSHAERKARRVLARYLRHLDRLSEEIVIR